MSPAFRACARAALFFAVTTVAACGRPDADVQAAVKGQLAKDPVTAPLDLTVDVQRGVVTLAGQTSTIAEQTRASEIVRSIEGVKEVTNQMSIADGLLVEAVKKALAADPLLGSVPIEVDSRNGYVRLISNDTNKEQRDRAREVAKSVGGVKGVEDRMK